MKKIFTFFLAALFSVGAFANTYYYRGADNSWKSTAMTPSEDGFYEYIQSSNNAHQFKIALSEGGWDYNYSFVTKNFNGTDVENIGDYGSDNCYCWQSGTYYILVYYPNTTVNVTDKPVICASTTLPKEETTFVHTYTVAGEPTALFGGENTWGIRTENDMTLNDGLYTWTRESVELAKGTTVSFKVFMDHSYTIGYPAANYNLNIEEAGTFDVTITFDESTKEVNAILTQGGEVVIFRPEIKLHGNFSGSWKDTDSFTKAKDQATATLTLNLTKGETYNFGVKISDTWTANGKEFTRGGEAQEVVAGSGNLTLTADQTGIYTFTWTYDANTLAVEFPEYTYAVTFAAELENGAIKRNDEVIASGNEFSAGTELSVVPNSGQKVKSVSVAKTEDLSDVTITVYNAETKIITVPSYAITVTVEFEKDDATAIDNTEVGAKAVKAIENGQLIIRRDGKTFTAQGQLVK